jgi:hypothetical protein
MLLRSMHWPSYLQEGEAHTQSTGCELDQILLWAQIRLTLSLLMSYIYMEFLVKPEI